jgi:sulfur relay (sulfurtransferase) complex TusBCD TusD component (DsrE family)
MVEMKGQVTRVLLEKENKNTGHTIAASTYTDQIYTAFGLREKGVERKTREIYIFFYLDIIEIGKRD